MISLLFEWLAKHPWGWLLVFVGAGLGFVAWLRQPLTWRNAEGNLVDDSRRIAGWMRWWGG